MKSTPWLLVMLAAPVPAQTADSTTLNITFSSGIFSINNVGSPVHSFSPLSVDNLVGTQTPLRLTSTPRFLITNIGNAQGWSLNLSAIHGPEHTLELDYQPGSGQIQRLSGLRLPGDLDLDADFGGGLASGRKVLSAPANTNQGLFLYSPAPDRWFLILPNQERKAGQFTWTLQATLNAAP
ncbi:hypothetical protein JST97_32125 [bacterium]|nr:hypothetical protein [bacterium]